MSGSTSAPIEHCHPEAAHHARIAVANTGRCRLIPVVAPVSASLTRESPVRMSDHSVVPAALPAPHHQVALFDRSACAGYAEQVLAVRQHWIERMPGRLHTLGAAAYLDAPDPASLRAHGGDVPAESLYYPRAAASRAMMLARFGALYDAIRDALDTLLDAPTRVTEIQALPGFHVYHSGAEHAVQRNHVPHYDRPYLHLDWEEPVDTDRTLSFTLPLSLPGVGGGLRLWPVDYLEMRTLPRDAVKARLRSTPPADLDYTPGTLVVHSGHHLHQIRAWSGAPGELRITLQGHAIRAADHWLLYW